VLTIAGAPDAIDQIRRSGRITGTKTPMVLDTWRPGDDRER
jgi:hypothetical protein